MTARAALLLITLAAAPLQAQSVSRGDSLRILKSAKSAQARFESRRRLLAPVTNTGSKGTCQMIGRFCRRASGIPFDQIPLEPGETTRARLELLLALETSASKLPGDDWIAGQRVRYLIEAGNDTAAIGIARSCVATRWWCDALLGLAAHASNRFVAAEQAFARALTEMPSAKRCEWIDLTQLLDDGAAKSYRRLDCAAKEAADRKIWWLADPLFSTPGNERRTEHLARHVWADIDRGGTNGFGMKWAPDLTEMIVRFGWAEKWTQRPSAPMSDGSQAYMAHEREPDFHFIAALPIEAPLSSFTDSAWRLDEEDAREGYSPRYVKAFVSLNPQTARFARGDSTLVVAAFDVAGDTAWKSGGVRPALIIARSDTSRFLLARFDSSAARSALWVTAPSYESLGGLELLSLDGSVAGRWRGVIEPLSADSARRNISDALLFDATDSLASTVDGAIASAFGSDTTPQDRKIGVYWETYGATPADSARAVSLTLTPIAPGLVTRMLRSLGVGKKLEPIAVRWTDAAPDAGIQMRSVLLDLSQVTAGRYELRVAVGEGSAAQTTSRRIVISKGAARLATTFRPDLRR